MIAGKQRSPGNHNKPLIGIAPCYAPRKNAMWHMAKEAYSYSIWDADGIPILLTYPNSAGRVAEIISTVDGIVMIGGPDIPIETYGGNPYDLMGEEPMHPRRISFDRNIFRICQEQGKPVLGICAGIQHINVICGGTLYEDISVQLPHALDHGSNKGSVVSHPVEVDRSSLVFDVMRKDSVSVNSTHHQGIRKLGCGLKATSVSTDGLIEAIEPADGQAKFIAVQWHPEMMQHDELQMGLFRWVVEEART